MKIAPIWIEMKKRASLLNPIILHTGQPFDYGMSEIFFKGLKLPSLDIYLGVGSCKIKT
ncbi:hypothetical protein ACFLRM_05855 [Acidobacteriota bacterium]